MQTRLQTDWPGRSREALAALSKARACARDLKIDPWEFAVPLLHLESLGVEKSDLRWLIVNGYATFRDRARRLQPDTTVLACGDPGFIITDAGQRAAKVDTLDVVLLRPGVPRWDKKLRQLSFDGQIVKRFSVPAANQEAVLLAFEEAGWPPSIDDPLPFLPEQRAKERLHATIRCLNANQQNRVLRFRGDGTGEAVLWQPLVEISADCSPPRFRRAA